MKTLILLLLPLLPLQGDAARQVGPVLMCTGESKIEMRYSVAAKRGEVAGFGVFAKSKEYFVFSGQRAALRATPSVAFEFDVPSDLNPESNIYLIRFETKTDRREIRTGIVGARSSKQGVPDDRRVHARFTALSAGDSKTARYRLTPVEPLKPGEYCLVRSKDTCFDFGVDR